jgi:hypothetical protein
METVYNKALLPILEGALRSKHITKIPEVHELLETAHILPAKNDNRPKPIIARFYSRNLSALIFRLKCEYAPTTTSPPPSSASSSSSAHPGKKTFRYPIYEDLTKDTFNLLQALLKDERTGPVWTVSGNIRYKVTPPSRRCPPSTIQWTRSLLSEFSFSASIELLIMKIFRLWHPPAICVS